jgi:hypothetical protein
MVNIRILENVMIRPHINLDLAVICNFQPGQFKVICSQLVALALNGL